MSATSPRSDVLVSAQGIVEFDCTVLQDASIGFSVRQARPTDYESCCALWEEIDAFHRDHRPDRYMKPNGPARTRNYFSSLLADDTVALFIAESGKGVVGLTKAEIMHSRDIPILKQRTFVSVDTVVVSEQCQGQGIGRALIEAVKAWARANGADSVELSVYDFNEARSGSTNCWVTAA